MVTYVSATVRETPHVNETSRTNTIINALKRRAQAVLKDRSIDLQTRAIIRYALEINDPWLADLVRRVDAGESTGDTIDFSQTPQSIEDELSEEKIEALAEMICQASDEAAAALLMLMGTLENSAHPKVLANTAKHLAFTRCGESNLYGMVDVQIAVVEGECYQKSTRCNSDLSRRFSRIKTQIESAFTCGNLRLHLISFAGALFPKRRAIAL